VTWWRCGSQVHFGVYEKVIIEVNRVLSHGASTDFDFVAKASRPWSCEKVGMMGFEFQDGGVEIKNFVE
jgi:hypothetical protein